MHLHWALHLSLSALHFDENEVHLPIPIYLMSSTLVLLTENYMCYCYLVLDQKKEYNRVVRNLPPRSRFDF